VLQASKAVLQASKAVMEASKAVMEANKGVMEPCCRGYVSMHIGMRYSSRYVTVEWLWETGMLESVCDSGVCMLYAVCETGMLESLCEDYGQAVKYKGTIPGIRP
jgi:hypothetical protein